MRKGRPGPPSEKRTSRKLAATTPRAAVKETRMATNSNHKRRMTMRTEKKNAIAMTELSNASELSNDQLESVAGGFGFTPAVQAMVSAMVASGTPTQVANYNTWVQYQTQGVPPSQQPPV